MKPTSSIFDDVKVVMVESLGLGDREATLRASTPLFGSMPEFDSLAAVQLVLALEQKFGLTINDDEISGEVFETVGSLAAFIEERIR